MSRMARPIQISTLDQLIAFGWAVLNVSPSNKMELSEQFDGSVALHNQVSLVAS